MMRISRVGFVFAACVLAAPLHAQTPAIHDSAGIRIVENGSRAKTPVVFRIAPAPSLEVGGLEDDPKVEFDHNQGFLRSVQLSGGGLAVIDVVRVHFFDANGKRLRVVGRNGSGPGEFRYLIAICRTRGDTVLVEDARTRRVTVMDATGNVIRELSDMALGALPPDGCLDDGFIRERLDRSSPQRSTILTRLKLDGTVVWTSSPIIAPAPDIMTQQRLSLASGGDRVYFGTGERSELRAIGPGGKLVQIIRTDDRSEPSSGTQTGRQPPAKTSPAYANFHVDPTGRLWVRDYGLATRAFDWTAFNAAGKIIGRLVLPAPAKGEFPPEVISFGENNVLLRRWDADGAAHLSVFPILRVGANAP